MPSDVRGVAVARRVLEVEALKPAVIAFEVTDDDTLRGDVAGDRAAEAASLDRVDVVKGDRRH